MSESFSTLHEAEPISRPPSGWETGSDRSFRGLTKVFAWLTILLVFLILLEIGRKAVPAIQQFGPELVTSKTWDTNTNPPQYGILPAIWGTLYSSILGVAIGAAFGVAIAIFLSQDFLPHKVEVVFKNIIEL